MLKTIAEWATWMPGSRSDSAWPLRTTDCPQTQTSTPFSRSFSTSSRFGLEPSPARAWVEVENHGNLGTGRGKLLLGVEVDQPGGALKAAVHLARRGGGCGVKHDPPTDPRPLARLGQGDHRAVALDLRKLRRQREPGHRRLAGGRIGRLGGGWRGKQQQGGKGQQAGKEPHGTVSGGVLDGRIGPG